MRAGSAALKRFLFSNLYRHPQVQSTRARAEQVLRDLFDAYSADATEMPADFAERPDRERACADYIAGMTDRFAIREHQRLTGKTLF
jgi:dGTPase